MPRAKAATTPSDAILMRNVRTAQAEYVEVKKLFDEADRKLKAALLAVEISTGLRNPDGTGFDQPSEP